MILKIKIDSNIDNDFIEFLIKKIKQYILHEADTKKLAAFDKYLIRTLDLGISAARIVVTATDNLKYIKTNKTYTIEIDNNVYLVNKKAKLYDMCKLINFGNLSIKGYPIFTDTFEHFKHNLNDYISMYRMAD